MRTETINGVEYQIGKLDAFKQLHVGRKLAPMLAHAIPAFIAIMKDGEKPDLEGFLEHAAGLAVPIAEVLAKMPEADVDYVIAECLAVCQRHQGKGWAKVTAPGGALMFQDIEADTLVLLTKAVVEVSLARFFPTPQPDSAPAARE